MKTLRIPEKYRNRVTAQAPKRDEAFKDSPAWKKVPKKCPACIRKGRASDNLFVVPDFGLRWSVRGGERVRDPQSHCRRCRSEDSAERKRNAMNRAR